MVLNEYRYKGLYTVLVNEKIIYYKKDGTSDFEQINISDIYKKLSYMSPGQISFNGFSGDFLRYLAYNAIPDTYKKNHIPYWQIPISLNIKGCPIIKTYQQCFNLFYF